MSLTPGSLSTLPPKLTKVLVLLRATLESIARARQWYLRPAKPGTVTEPGLIAQSRDVAVGATATLSLILAPGSYVLMCNQPAHYLIGMHTAFTIN